MGKQKAKIEETTKEEATLENIETPPSDPIIWQTTKRKLQDLIDYEDNPRLMTTEAFDQLKESLIQDGYHHRITINHENIIIGGHSRKRAMLAIGIPPNKEIEVLIPDRNVSQEEFKRINIRDNLSYGGFDFEKLANQFEIEELLGMHFPQELLPPIVEHLDAEEASEKDDKMPEFLAEPISKPGDLYILGEHRLLCGDSTVATHVEKLLDGQMPNTMVTDPPYGVKYEADWRADAKGRKKTEREQTSNLQNDDRADWYDAYVLFPGNVAYVWHASAYTDVVMDGLRRAGFDIKQQIVWNKNVHALSRSDYHWKHEPCWYAVKPDGERNWKGGRNQMTVWDIKSVIFEENKTSHPTQKPVEIYTRALKHHTNPGEYVYDPFGGSGTLIIACEKMQRRALVMELDPKFVDVIVKRWEDFTKKKAQRIEA